MNTHTDKRTQMQHLMSMYQASGMRRKEFCAANNISINAFEYWQSQFKKEQKVKGFIPIVMDQTAHCPARLEVHYPNGVHITATDDLDLLRQLIHLY